MEQFPQIKNRETNNPSIKQEKQHYDERVYTYKGYDPKADGVIIGHYEGHKRGIASNHADPGHWFPKHGKSMDTFSVQVGVNANPDAMLKKVKEAGFKVAFIKYS